MSIKLKNQEGKILFVLKYDASTAWRLEDTKGRALVHMNRKGKLALSRFPDLSEVELDMLTEFYHGLSGDNPVSIKQFLKFEDEDEKFCS